MKLPHQQYINSSQLNETRVIFHGFTNQTSGGGFTFSANDGGLLVLLGLFDDVLGAFSLLLS